MQYQALCMSTLRPPYSPKNDRNVRISEASFFSPSPGAGATRGQKLKAETWCVASTQECSGFTPFEASLQGHRLICDFWGVMQASQASGVFFG